jgi:hypothetical protein
MLGTSLLSVPAPPSNRSSNTNSYKPSTFLFETLDIELGYAQVSTLDLLNHLYLNYGSVTANELSTNMDNLSRQGDASQQLEDLWAQIIKCKAFAKDYDPITKKTILRVTINNLEKSGVFTQAIQDWRKLKEADHTIANMKTTFNLANKEAASSISQLFHCWLCQPCHQQ